MKRAIPLPSLSVSVEAVLKIIVTAGFFGWNFLEGAFFDHPYPAAMVRLYEVPLWRIVFLLLVLLAADWCPSVAIMLGFFIFFYIMDMEVTQESWSAIDLGSKRTEGN